MASKTIESKVKKILETNLGWIKGEDVPLHIEAVEKEIIELIKGVLPRKIDTIGKIDEWGTGFNACLFEIQKRIAKEG